MFTHQLPTWNLNLQLIMGDQYNYIIDTGLGSLSIAPIMEYIKNNKKPIIVINTHYHWDHIWGNRSLQNCLIISHTLCKELIELNWEEMIQKNKKYLKGEAELCLPNLTFEKEIYFPEDKIRIMHTPGHTMDSISVLDAVDKVLHVGDNVGDTLDEIIPNIDCSKKEYMNTLLMYKEMDFDTCVSGHNVILEKQVIDKILNLL